MVVGAAHLLYGARWLHIATVLVALLEVQEHQMLFLAGLEDLRVLAVLEMALLDTGGTGGAWHGEYWFMAVVEACQEQVVPGGTGGSGIVLVSHDSNTKPGSSSIKYYGKRIRLFKRTPYVQTWDVGTAANFTIEGMD